MRRAQAPLEETLRGIRIAITALAAMLAVAAAIPAAHAQANFPSRVVKLIVPYPPGGGTDLLARVLADQLGRKWGQAVIVENIGGAGGNIGASGSFPRRPRRLYAAARLARPDRHQRLHV